MTDTYKVTIPLSVTLEIDANTGPKTADMIREIFADAFAESAPFDPMGQLKIHLQHNAQFAVDDTATIKTAILQDGAEIAVYRMTYG